MEKYKNCMILWLLGDKKANKTKNMAQSCFSGGYVKYNSLYISNNWTQLNMAFHVTIIFLGNIKI